MNEKPKVYLGIDPGTVITGFGVIKELNGKFETLDFGCIKPPPKYPLNKRYFIIFSSVESLINKYKPDAIAIESQFVHKNVQSALKLGMAKGSVIIAAEKTSVPIFEYAPKAAKLAISGNGCASKEQVQKMIKLLLNLTKEPTPFDAADALALAICHANRIKFLEKTRQNNV